MCGLAGFVSGGAETAEALLESVRRMSGAIAHRGPDDAGEWIDATNRVAIGFRRLAILDVSPAGQIVKEVRLLPEGADGGHLYMRNARRLENGKRGDHLDADF